jgi:hypothetical protein
MVHINDKRRTFISLFLQNFGVVQNIPANRPTHNSKSYQKYCIVRESNPGRIESCDDLVATIQVTTTPTMHCTVDVKIYYQQLWTSSVTHTSTAPGVYCTAYNKLQQCVPGLTGRGMASV